MMEPANRIQHIEEYYFSKKLREIEVLRNSGIEIINAGVGSPDLHPHESVLTALNDALQEPNAHQYQSYKGIPELRKAISSWYKNYYNVTLNPEKEILPLIGSKEGIMHISLAFLNKGDQVLVPNPGYPTYASASKIVEADIICYDLSPENNWLPNLASIESKNLSKVKIMWINYPHMPTGANATVEDLEKIAAFGKKHDILICHDNPYSFILNQNPISLLEINEYKSHVLELNSLSKSHNMAGWRLGMVAANEDIIKSILKVKSNMDSGMFFATQKAAVKALSLESDWYNHLNKTYESRRKLAWEICDELHLDFDKSSSGLFIWGRIRSPKSCDLTFTDKLLQKHGVFITPGSIFGSNGKGFVRMSLCLNENTLSTILNRIQKK